MQYTKSSVCLNRMVGLVGTLRVSDSSQFSHKNVNVAKTNSI